MSRSRFVYVLKRLALIEAVILAIVGVFCLLAGWGAADEIGMALLIAGVLVFAFGPMTLMGGWGSTRSWGYQYIQTMREEAIHERASEHQAEMSSNMGLVWPSMLLGSFTIGLSVLVPMLFG